MEAPPLESTTSDNEMDISVTINTTPPNLDSNTEGSIDREGVPGLGVGSTVGVVFAALIGLALFMVLLIIGAIVYYSKRRGAAQLSSTKALSAGIL